MDKTWPAILYSVYYSSVGLWAQTEPGVLRPHAACVYCHPQSMDKYYSTVGLWTQTEPGVLRPHAIWLCILSSSVNGNHHDQQSLDCILFPPSVCGHVQQKAVLAHCMFLSPVYIWKHPWPVTLWLLFPTSGYGHNYSEQCGFGLHISPVYNYMEKPMTSYLLSTASNLRLWTSLFRATRPWFACS